MPKINVSAKVISDLSSGIYRSPANALKELISNAFDADADNVVIRTNRPFYKTITYYDDGNGMSPEDFRWTMSHIGGSRKREGGEILFTKKGRPLIGKIGIGILAVAQICQRFTVISSKKGGNIKFEANVDLKKFEEPDVYKLVLTDKKIPIGDYELFEYPGKREEHYTKFILHEIREDFKTDLEDEREGFIDYSRSDTGEKPLFDSAPSKNFRDYIEWLQTKDIRKLKDYWRLLWELALYSPIEYFDDGPVLNERILINKKKELKKYNLRVDIDGFVLKKPILLPVDKDIKDKGIDYAIYEINSEEKGIDSEKLKFSGYIYNQRKQIKNSELQGLLIRIKNIAIGKYDKSYLNCPISLGPIATFNSGEIYIEHGLEEALNIDRNSFKESNRHYKELQKYIYQLMSKIYRDTRKRSAERIAIRKESQIEAARKKIMNSVDLLKDRFQIQLKSLRHDLSEEPEQPIKYENNVITLYPKHNIFQSRTMDKIFLEKLLIFLELNKKINIVSDPQYYKIFLEYLKNSQMIKNRKQFVDIEEKKEQIRKLYRAPIKHFVREKGWVEAAKKRKNHIGDRRELRYFTLCSLDAIDIKTLNKAGIIKKENTVYESTFFCEWDNELIEEIARAVGPNYFGGAFEEFIDRVYINKDGWRDKLVTLELFPFDVYNLDFTGSCIPGDQPPYSKTLQALQKLVDLQHREQHDFDLLLTFPANRGKDNEEAIKQLKHQIDNNCAKFPKAKEKIETIYSNTDTLLNNYENFILVAIPKFLLKVAKDFSYILTISPSFKYKRSPKDAESYYITSSILSFKYYHGLRGSATNRLNGPSVADIIHRRYYPKSIINIFKNEIIDVDKEFNRDKSLIEDYRTKIEKVMAS